MSLSISKPDHGFIKSILPEKFPFAYNPVRFTKQPVEKHDVGYQLEMSVSNIGTVEELNEFIREFGRKNQSLYTLTNSSKKDAFYRAWYKCQYYHKCVVNPTSRKKKRKGTECESKISTVMHAFKNDPTKKFAKMKINFIHNHSLTPRVALRYRAPSIIDVQQEDNNLLPAVDEKEVEAEIAKFEKSVEVLTEKIRANPTYYLDGLKSLNKDLAAALNSCPANVLKMMYSLNKSTGSTPKRRTRSRKKIEVNAAALTQRQKPAKQSTETDHIEKSERTPHSLSNEMHHNIQC